MELNLTVWIILLSINLIGMIGNWIVKQKKIAILNAIGTVISIFVIIHSYIL